MWVGCLEVKEEENISEGSGHGNERNGYMNKQTGYSKLLKS
jgi:hypothetical protein